MVAMSNQVFLIQPEVTPGTPVTNAMKRVLAMKATPGWDPQGGESFTPSGHKVPVVYVPGPRTAKWGIDMIGCYNALGVPAKCVLGTPVTTTPAGGTTSKQHVFTPAAAAADAKNAYTGQWGEASKGAVQGSFLVFQELSPTIDEYGKFGVTTSAISKDLDETVSLATTGVTDMPVVVIDPLKLDVFVDDTWANLGTTKAQAAYKFGATNPTKYALDQPINSQTNGFADIAENSDIGYAVSFMLGFDAAGRTMVGKWKAGQVIFLRMQSIGPLIEATIYHKMMWDYAVLLTKVGDFGPVSGGVAAMPFEGIMIKDPTSGFFQQLTLINKLAGY